MHVLIIPGEELNERNTYSSVFELHQAKALRNAGLTCGFVSIDIKNNLFEAIKNVLLFKPKAFELLKNLLNSESTNFLDVEGFNVVESVGYYCWAGKFKTKYQEQVQTALLAVEQYIKKYGRPDIVHAHSRFLTGGLIGIAIKKKYNIPFVLTEHSTYYARNLVSSRELNLVANAINSSSTWITVSPELGKLVTTLLPSALNKDFNYIPNVLDAYFEPETIKIKNTEANFTFLNIASLEQKKGHSILLQSFAASFRGNEYFQLQIAGSGSLESQLKELVIQLKIDKQVSFLGQLNRNEIFEAYSNANVFVLPSLYETFGVVLIEALAMGKPIIATKCGGPENIVNEQNGYLVEVDDVHELSKGLEKIVKDYNSFSPTLIKTACIKKFGSLAFAKSITSVYNKAIKN